MILNNPMMLAQFQPSKLPNYFAHYRASNSTLEYVDSASTVTGTSGTNAIVYSGSQTGILGANMQVRYKGTDVYTVLTVSGVNVTVSPNLVQGYVADVAAQQRIASLNDLSPNGYHATGSSSTEPSYWPSQNRSKPVIRFDNSKFLTLPTGFYSNFSTGDNTAIIVAQGAAQDVSVNTLFALSGSGVVKNAMFFNVAGNGDIEYRSANTAAAAVSSGDITQTNMSFYVGRRSGTTVGISQNNGTEQTNSNGANTTADSGRIGFTPAGASPLTGQIAEMIFYNRSLSTQEITSLYNYVLQEYAIS